MASSAAKTAPRAPQPGRAQRRDARGAAGRDDRVPRRGRLREHDDEPRGRARRALARRAPAPLPDAPGAAGGGDGAPRRAPRREQLLAAAEELPDGRERLARRASTCCGRATPARSTRRRSTCGRTRAPTPSCASAWRRSSATSTARRCASADTLFGELAERPGFDRLIEMAARDDARARAARHAAPRRRAQPPPVAVLPRSGSSRCSRTSPRRRPHEQPHVHHRRRHDEVRQAGHQGGRLPRLGPGGRRRARSPTRASPTRRSSRPSPPTATATRPRASARSTASASPASRS